MRMLIHRINDNCLNYYIRLQFHLIEILSPFLKQNWLM